jgi:hypothetical protein
MKRVSQHTVGKHGAMPKTLLSVARNTSAYRKLQASKALLNIIGEPVVLVTNPSQTGA